MAYIFKFKNNEKIVNLVKANPRVSFFFFSGSAYYNNQYAHSGSFSDSSLGVPSGYISLYEQNIDRTGSIDFVSVPIGASMDPFSYAVNMGDGYSPTDYYVGTNPGAVTFKVKDGTRVNFKTVSTKEFNAATGGRPLTRDYPLSSSVQKYYYADTSNKFETSYLVESSDTEVTGSVTYLAALKNTLNYHARTNLNYLVSSSVRDLTSSVPANGAIDVGLVTIPSIFYGNSIEKGTVNLKFFITGTLIGELQDTNRNGDLIQVGPAGSPGSGSVAGVALYEEGFLVLTSSVDLSNGEHTEEYITAGVSVAPSWVNFAQTISASAPNTKNSSFSLDFSGSTKTPTMTLFATANKGDLNHSNNPTYIDKDTQVLLSSGSLGYTQNPDTTIKNIVSSSYPDPTGSFTKTTYISKIGIYDKNKNLIAIAKLATPVKKTPHRDFTFKIKLDI
jgi:hypothetical protein